MSSLKRKSSFFKRKQVPTGQKEIKQLEAMEQNIKDNMEEIEKKIKVYELEIVASMKKGNKVHSRCALQTKKKLEQTLNQRADCLVLISKQKMAVETAILQKDMERNLKQFQNFVKANPKHESKMGKLYDEVVDHVAGIDAVSTILGEDNQMNDDELEDELDQLMAEHTQQKLDVLPPPSNIIPNEDIQKKESESEFVKKIVDQVFDKFTKEKTVEVEQEESEEQEIESEPEIVGPPPEKLKPRRVSTFNW